MIRNIIGFFLIFFMSATLGAQDFSQVKIKTIPVVPGIYMLVGTGGNIGVSVGADGVLVVDDQFAPLAPKIKAALKKLNPQPVKFVVNTHWHGDHTGGNEVFGKSGAIIVAHENVRKRLTTVQFNAFLQKKTPPSPKAAWPVMTFTRDLTFHFNGQTIEVFHVDSAHTDGDGFVYFKQAKVLHTGDLYFAGMYPYIDVRSGGGINGMIAAIDRLIREMPSDVKIIPGHGPLSNLGELKTYRKMLATIRDRVKKLKQSGKTLSEVIAAKPTAEFDAQWNNGFLKNKQFITIVYESLK